MRPLGYTLLIAGFIWVFASPLAMRADARDVTIKRYSTLPTKDAFARQEVLMELRDQASNIMAAAIPNLWCPSLMMLVGAVLLDRRAGRQVTQGTQIESA